MREDATVLAVQADAPHSPPQIDLQAVDLTVEDEWDPAGSIDGHVHWDRVFTAKDEYYPGGVRHFENLPLGLKQNAVGVLHGGKAFEDACLRKRMMKFALQKAKVREKKILGITDCSADIEDRSFRIGIELRERLKSHIDIKVGVYPIFGFKSFRPEDRRRHELAHDLSDEGDFFIGLPERDARPDHAEIGFDRHISIGLDIGIKQKKKGRHFPVFFHFNQTGLPSECGTSRFVEAVNWKLTNSLPFDQRPEVWVVHDISPASYDDERFEKHVYGLRQNNIGLVVCPHAAVSMRQYRNVMVPMHNCIARVMECLLAGVPVMIGTDNVRDMFCKRPASPYVVRELDIFASALRFYEEHIIYKLLRGEPLDNSDLVSIAESVDDNYRACGLPPVSEKYLSMNRTFAMA